MKIDNEKLEAVLKSLASDVGGMCTAASVFIGEVNRKPVYITVMSKKEAREEHDYEGTPPKHLCIDVPPQTTSGQTS